MLLEFSVANWYSFKDKVTFSMLASSSQILEENFVVKNNYRILKSAAIYGANASGKSNLFKILAGIILMLRQSNNVDINAKLPIKQFKGQKEMKPSEFEIRFMVDNINYIYGFKADINVIYEEYLYYYPKGRETKIFYRHDIDKYDFTVREERHLKDIALKNSQNKFFLATATNWNYEKTKPAYDFLTQAIDVFFDLEELKSNAFKMYENDNDGKLKEFALAFLKAADFNIVDYEITKVDIPNKILLSMSELVKIKIPENQKAYQVIFKHNGNLKIDLAEESFGTQIIFAFIPFIAEAIQNQKILIIDELNRSLHPYLSRYIVQMFNDNSVNLKASQLIFNTNDTNLLDLDILRRDQIWFTEKNNETGNSDLYSLNDFSVRSKENIEKGYMLGRYGAVPFINNDINLWFEE